MDKKEFKRLFDEPLSVEDARGAVADMQGAHTEFIEMLDLLKATPKGLKRIAELPKSLRLDGAEQLRSFVPLIEQLADIIEKGGV